MDTKYFKYVIEIVECGSINKASQNLGISQPNLSVCIKNMEQELGFDIFSRKHSGITLTKEGQLFLESAKKISRELEVIKKIPSLFVDTDNLSISSTYSFDFMNAFIKFKQKNPPMQYEDSFKETGVMQSIRDLIEQRYRMALIYCFDSVRKNYYELARKHNLKIVSIAKKQPLALLVSKKNPLSLKDNIPFEKIKEYPFMMYENFIFEEWLKILGFENDNKILYVFDRGGLIDTIKQSKYVTVTMKSSFDAHNKECVEIPIIHSPFNLNVYIMYHNSYILNEREKKFIKQLKMQLKSNETTSNSVNS